MPWIEDTHTDAKGLITLVGTTGSSIRTFSSLAMQAANLQVGEHGIAPYCTAPAPDPADALKYRAP